VGALSFSSADILAEFVEAAGVVVPGQLEFDYCAFIANRRRWDTTEERERGRRRYASRQHSYFSPAARARRMVRARVKKQLAPARAALKALRLERQKRRAA
jgi:hypothetical protein